MLLMIVGFVMLYGGGIVAGWVVLRSEHLRDDGRFQVAVLLWLVMSGIVMNLGIGLSLLMVAAATPAGLLYAGTLAYFFSTLVLRIRTMSVGDHKLKVEPTFDQAEAAEKRGDMEAAVRLYQASVKGHPEHAESRRRLGEAYLRGGDVDNGIQELRAALGFVEDPERKMALAFRVADLLVEKKADTFNAGMILQSLERDFAGTRIEELARARRARIGA